MKCFTVSDSFIPAIKLNKFKLTSCFLFYSEHIHKLNIMARDAVLDYVHLDLNQ